MATRQELINGANQIRTATTEGFNSAERIGRMFSQIIDSVVLASETSGSNPGETGGAGTGPSITGIRLTAYESSMVMTLDLSQGDPLSVTIPAVTAEKAGLMTNADRQTLTKALTDIQASAQNVDEIQAMIGAVNGLVPLDANAKISTTYIPTEYKEVLEFKGTGLVKDVQMLSVASGYDVVYSTATKTFVASKAATTVGGMPTFYGNWAHADAYGTFTLNGRQPVAGKIYIDTTTHYAYRWDGANLVGLNGADELKGIQGQIVVIKKQGEDTQAEVEGLQGWKNTAAAQVATLSEQVGVVNTSLSAVQKDVNNTKDDLGKLTDSTGRRLTALEKSDTDTKTQVGSILTDTTNLKDWKVDMEATSSLMQQSVNSVVTENGRLKSVTDSLSADNRTLKNWKTKVDEKTAAMEGDINATLNDTENLKDWKQQVDETTDEMRNEINGLKNEDKSIDDDLQQFKEETYDENAKMRTDITNLLAQNEQVKTWQIQKEEEGVPVFTMLPSSTGYTMHSEKLFPVRTPGKVTVASLHRVVWVSDLKKFAAMPVTGKHLYLDWGTADKFMNADRTAPLLNQCWLEQNSGKQYLWDGTALRVAFISLSEFTLSKAEIDQKVETLKVDTSAINLKVQQAQKDTQTIYAFLDDVQKRTTDLESAKTTIVNKLDPLVLDFGVYKPKIVTLERDVKTLNTDNETSKVNWSKVSTLQVQVSTLETDLSTTATKAANAETVANEAKIKALSNATSLGKVTSEVATLQTEVDGNKKNVSTLQGLVKTIDTTLSGTVKKVDNAQKTATDALNASTANATSLESVTTNINSLQTTVDGSKTLVATLQGQVKAFDKDLKGTMTRVNNVSQTASDALNASSVNATAIDDVTEQVNTIKGGVQVNTSAISSMTSKVNSIKESVTGVDTRLANVSKVATQAQEAASQNATSLQSVTADVSTLQTGLEEAQTKLASVDSKASKAGSLVSSLRTTVLTLQGNVNGMTANVQTMSDNYNQIVKTNEEANTRIMDFRTAFGVTDDSETLTASEMVSKLKEIIAVYNVCNTNVGREQVSKTHTAAATFLSQSALGTNLPVVWIPLRKRFAVAATTVNQFYSNWNERLNYMTEANVPRTDKIFEFADGHLYFWTGTKMSQII